MSNITQRIAILRNRLAGQSAPPGALPKGMTLRNEGTVKAPYPPSLKEMYGLTCAPECGLLDFHTEVNFGEEPVHDSEGTPIETTEQWLRIGISGNDRIFVGMHTGTIALYDPDFYRYGETSGLRLIAPDMLSFFEKCLHAHSYATILQLDSEDEDEWHSFLIENPA